MPTASRSTARPTGRRSPPGRSRCRSRPPSARLAVTITPADDQLAPGAATTLGVGVAAADGTPVAGADLLVVVVDEAVLALSGYQLADPAASFYAHLPTDVAATFGRDGIVLVDPAPAARRCSGRRRRDRGHGAGRGARPRADDDDARRRWLTWPPTGGRVARLQHPPARRSPCAADFEAARPVRPRRHHRRRGAGGGRRRPARQPHPLPRDGRGRRPAPSSSAPARPTITAELPLMVRPSPPRFLNFGDRFELPVVVQNQTDAAAGRRRGRRAANSAPTPPAGLRVTVPANDRVEVRFPRRRPQTRAPPRFRVGGRERRRAPTRRRVAARVDAGHDRGVRHLRRDRRGRRSRSRCWRRAT